MQERVPLATNKRRRDYQLGPVLTDRDSPERDWLASGRLSSIARESFASVIGSILDDVEIGDESVRRHVDQEAAIGLVGRQPIVEDATHPALVTLDLACGRVLLREEDDGLQACRARRGAVAEILACSGREQGRIGDRLPSLREGLERGDDLGRPRRVGIGLGFQGMEQGTDARRLPSRPPSFQRNPPTCPSPSLRKVIWTSRWDEWKRSSASGRNSSSGKSSTMVIR